MTRILKTFCLLAVVCLAACSGQDPLAPDPASISPTLQGDSGTEEKTRKGGEPINHYYHANKEALGRQTFHNAYKLERAVWRFAAENDGRVPGGILWDTNLVGKTLFDYLPAKKPLTNPFHLLRTEPQFGPASAHGQVGYLDIYDNQGYLIGFVISAFGAGTHQQLEIIRYMEGKGPGLARGEPK
jgi:hypothetical protein